MNRKQSAIIQIVAFSITAIVLCAVLVFGLVNKNFSLFNFRSGYTYKDSDKYTAGNGEIDGNGIKEIDINWLSGTINISAYDGDTLKITETSNKPLEKKDLLHYYNNNGKLFIEYASPQRNFNFKENKTLEILVPHNIASELKELSIDAISSDANVTDISANKINFDSMSGDLYITNFVAKELEFDTMSGNVDAQGSVDYKVEFDTMSGELDLDTDICPKKVSCDTVSGNVTITVPENNGITFSKESISGSFTVDFETMWKDDKGIYQNGENDFSFDTVSGNITVNKK